MICQNLPENLIELLEDEGGGIAAFAESIGVSEWTVYSYLRGNAPETAILVRIADYFGCTTDFLLGLEPEGRQIAKNRSRPSPYGYGR